MNRLKELRKEKKLTQKELAEETDIPYRTLQRWENGETDIKSDKAEKLADFFGVSIGYLLGYYDKVNAKAKLLDIIISDGYILQSTLDKCISKLDEIDQLEIKKGYYKRKKGRESIMYTYEYRCLDCGERWEIIDSYPPIDCPKCESEDIYQIWKARAYE